MYQVKEIFYSICGEGFHVGRSAVFVRLVGCNLWNGQETDRLNAQCSFCDTNFIGTDGAHGGKYDSASLVEVCTQLIPKEKQDQKMVVFTGGEPSLQLDEDLIQAFNSNGFYTAIESNGTRPIPKGLDWICISPKSGTDIQVKEGHELKVVFPQPNLDTQSMLDWSFEHYYLQPKAKPNEPKAHWPETIEKVKTEKGWKLSLQTQKLLGLQ